jgi:hypothetical protein
MNLSPEDSLRLHVLLGNAEAVRIDENALVVYGLQGEREMRVQLKPTMRSDKYIGVVRELLASVVLDSPGGYPVFLRRWTRMGQIESDQLDRLLKIGEPEAVMAVVCSRSLTDEIARRAWWCAPYSDHARRMLAHPQIVNGSMGKILAEHLIEHLPFETEHREMMETVRLVLQPGLISSEQRRRLWESGKAKASYRIGFLATTPDDLLAERGDRADLCYYISPLSTLAASGSDLARLLLKLLSANGQSFIRTASEAMRRPADQDVVVALLNVIGRYFAAARLEKRQLRTLEEIDSVIEATLANPPPALAELLLVTPALAAEIAAMIYLAHLDEGVVIPIFSHTNAVGSVMRKRIEPIMAAIRKQFIQLDREG